MELLLAAPGSEPPPAPFSVPGGRQGMAWHLPLPAGAGPPASGPAAEHGDLLPGLLTAGTADGGGYLLVDLEHLRVTTVDGPPRLVNRVLATAAAELATSELAGWYDLIICGYSELDVTDGRAITCDNLDEALDLLAAKAVTLQRRLADGGPADVRYRRIAEPDDEDWALYLLVSRIPPTPAQLSFLIDITSEPGGIAAMVAGTGSTAAAPASFLLAADPDRPGGIVSQISPLQLEVRPQALTDEDYDSIVSLFETAALPGDVAADCPPYDGAAWTSATSPPGWTEDPDGDPLTELDSDLEPGDGASGGPDRDGVPAQAGTLRIGILGSFTVNGAAGALLPAQSQLILALALNGPVGLSNPQLGYLLGADPDHPKPSDSLRQLIARTRRQLGPAPRRRGMDRPSRRRPVRAAPGRAVRLGGFQRPRRARHGRPGCRGAAGCPRAGPRAAIHWLLPLVARPGLRGDGTGADRRCGRAACLARTRRRGCVGVGPRCPGRAGR